MATQQETTPFRSAPTTQQAHPLSPLARLWAGARNLHGATRIIQNSIPVRYDRRVTVVPCSPNRLPVLPVQILYLIAQALPRPKWVYNLARINRESWHYLQPALFLCEVTYEARLKDHFGIGDEHLPKGWWTEIQTSQEEEDRRCCGHGLKTTLCEECGEQIAIENLTLKGNFQASGLLEQVTNSDLTALHWACSRGTDGLSAGLKAIRAASVYQPSYIDGIGLLLRRQSWGPATGEIPPPLFLSVAFGNTKLCEALIQAGSNVNLLQPGECEEPRLPETRLVYRALKSLVMAKSHVECVPRPGEIVCRWDNIKRSDCQTVGHLAVYHRRPLMLERLLDSGLDPLLGVQKSLIHLAVSTGNVRATRLLLDRYPELSKNRRFETGATPLHMLCDIGSQDKNNPLQVFLEIGRSLIDSGADIEAKIQELIWLEATPLQTAIEAAFEDPSREASGLLAAEALITLGCEWDLPSAPHPSRESILEHCIYKATLLVPATEV